MNIFLGNITLKQLQEEHKFSISQEHFKELNDMRQDSAQKIAKGKFHIFDIPRHIMCSDMETAQKVYDILKNYDIKGRIDISIQ